MENHLIFSLFPRLCLLLADQNICHCSLPLKGLKVSFFDHDNKRYQIWSKFLKLKAMLRMTKWKTEEKQAFTTVRIFFFYWFPFIFSFFSLRSLWWHHTNNLNLKMYENWDQSCIPHILLEYCTFFQDS